jgi:U3 small nucleolar RNA-associated protein 12
MKFVAVALLDSTIKLFYFDTLKFHLAMYGHSLPVLSIDISSDSQLLVSCSSDKTVRVWGLDFGDCHATMKHSDGLISCAFQEKTHYIFSAAKDTVNIYDADNHQRVQTLKGHVEGGATCMGVGGVYVATAGRDQTIRLYNRTQDLLVIEDEREQEREDELEKDAVVENPSLPALKTAESERSTDKLIEALDVYKEDSPSNPLYTAYNARDKTEFMLKILTQIKASELEQSVMLLPVEYVNRLIPAIGEVLEAYPLATELILRCLYSLMKFHLASISLSDKDVLKRVADLAEKRQKYLVDMIGFNLAGLKFLSDRREVKEEIQTFREMIGERKRKRKKKETAMKRALLKI